MKRLTGTVTKRSGAKTIAVQVRRVVVHPLYHKRHTKTKTYLVHDPAEVAEVGQEVSIEESRPVSKRKRWTLVTPNTAS